MFTIVRINWDESIYEYDSYFETFEQVLPNELNKYNKLVSISWQNGSFIEILSKHNKGTKEKKSIKLKKNK